MEEDAHDAMTALKSELAALQYKRDRLLSELNDMKAQIHCRDQRVLELELEAENLREQTARQNAIIGSLKKRIQELEEKEQILSIAQGRSETTIENLRRENKYQGDKIAELGKKIRVLETNYRTEHQGKLIAQEAMGDFVRNLSAALGAVDNLGPHSTHECLVRKASNLIFETTNLRTSVDTLVEDLNAVRLELNACREALEKATTERDSIQKKAASYLSEWNNLKQERDEMEAHLMETKKNLCEIKQKLENVSENLKAASVKISAQEAIINQIRDESKMKEERGQLLENELRRLLTTMAESLSTSGKFTESAEEHIKHRISEIICENQEKTAVSKALQEKINDLSTQLEKQSEITDAVKFQIRIVEKEKEILESRLTTVKEDLRTSELAKESLKTDKATFMTFLEKLGRALNSEEVTKDMELDLVTSSLLLRAEQLSRLETDKIINKTSAMYQMQRKLRTLREQLQRKDLHLNLLRRKIAAQEESFRAGSAIAVERDEANMKCKKLMKQIEKLQSQLVDGRSLSQDLKNQLAEAGEFKIAALERGRKVEELQKRLVDAESIITRLSKKMNVLKEQLRNTDQNANQERTISEHSLQLLRDDLANTKLSLAEHTKRENQLHDFRNSVCKALGLICAAPDFEIMSKLEKLVAAHRDFTILSRRYEDPISGTSPIPIRTPKYEDSGFLDQQDFSALEDNDDIFHKHSLRN